MISLFLNGDPSGSSGLSRVSRFGVSPKAPSTVWGRARGLARLGGVGEDSSSAGLEGVKFVAEPVFLRVRGERNPNHFSFSSGSPLPPPPSPNSPPSSFILFTFSKEGTVVDLS